MQQVALETGWDDSPHYMTPASWERIAAAKTRNQERTEYRTTAESLAYYARRAAGALEMDTMFCSAKYERDKEEANDDVSHPATRVAVSPVPLSLRAADNWLGCLCPAGGVEHS